MARRYRNKHGVSAWLVTWESPGQLDRDKVAAVLDPRRSAEAVKRAVELLYANTEYTAREKIRYAVKASENPYPARFGSLGGVQWQGQIICGHNPYLLARLVDELRAEQGEGDEERVEWRERPRPEVS